MQTTGIMSEFVVMEDDGESELVGFNHGPNCECGSVLNLFRERWVEMGSPDAIMVSVIPIEPISTVRGVVQGPWGLL